MRTRTHVVRAGECVASIAAKLGMTVDEVWALPENDALRRRRASPYVLKAGDVLRLRQTVSRAPPVTHAASNVFRAEVPMTRISLCLVRHPEHPDRPRERIAVSRTAVRVEVGDTVIETTTGEDGVVAFDAPASARYARLCLRPDSLEETRFVLALGGLDPHDDPEGAMHRLRNLGFTGLVAHTAPPTSAELADAVAAFQRWTGVEPTGVLDEATSSALREAHGC